MHQLALSRTNKESNPFEKEYGRLHEFFMEPSPEVAEQWSTHNFTTQSSSGYPIYITVTGYPQTGGTNLYASVVHANLPSVPSFVGSYYQYPPDPRPSNLALTISGVVAGEYILRAKEPLHLEVESDGSLLYAEDESLGISVFARDSFELESLLAEQILLVWNQYALENSNRLTPTAVKLKSRLLDFWWVDTNAAQK